MGPPIGRAATSARSVGAASSSARAAASLVTSSASAARLEDQRPHRLLQAQLPPPGRWLYMAVPGAVRVRAYRQGWSGCHPLVGGRGEAQPRSSLRRSRRGTTRGTTDASFAWTPRRRRRSSHAGTTSRVLRAPVLCCNLSVHALFAQSQSRRLTSTACQTRGGQCLVEFEMLSWQCVPPPALRLTTLNLDVVCTQTRPRVRVECVRR